MVRSHFLTSLATLGTGLLLASTAAQAQEQTPDNTLQVEASEVAVELPLTMAERSLILGWEGELRSNLAEGPVVAEIICAKRWTPKLNHCWVGEVENAPPARAAALSLVLNEYLFVRQGPTLSDAMTQAMLAPAIRFVTFPLALTLEDLAVPDAGEELRLVEPGERYWITPYRPARLRVEGDVTVAALCRTHADFTVNCRGVRAEPSERLAEMQLWLDDASLIMRVEPKLSDGSSAGNTIGAQGFTFK